MARAEHRVTAFPLQSEGNDATSCDRWRNWLLHDHRGGLLHNDRLRLGRRTLRRDNVIHECHSSHGGSGNGQTLKQTAPANMMVMITVNGHGMRMMMMMKSTRTREGENAARTRDNRNRRKNLSVELVHVFFPFFCTASSPLHLVG